MINVVDMSERAEHKKYSMSGFNTRNEADAYISLLQGRFVKGDFEYWESSNESRICVSWHLINKVTI